MKFGWNFDNTYRRLPEGFYSVLNPVPVPDPRLVLFNTRLARELGLDDDGVELQGQDPINGGSDELASQRKSGSLKESASLKKSDSLKKPGLFQEPKSSVESDSVFAGNQIPKGAEPIAQAYAGHQFGHFTMLGDGRAIVLGEHCTGDGKRYDIQLKGSGQTPYSRRGDGRATLYSMLREYLISESLVHLGIPATQSLAVAETGLPVYRETVHRGAVLTRVASSHLRFGTFEYVRHFRPPEELSQLLDYAVSRHYAGLKGNIALDFLTAVAQKHIKLVLEWMRTGFIHGVLNTDNMSISGETMDFGPCAFLNAYDPATAFSSVDTHGRYAFGNQPGIVQWNLAVLAGTLLHLIDKDEKKAEEKALEVIQNVQPDYIQGWYRMMARKLGFDAAGKNENELTDSLLSWMKKRKADYTNTFLVIASEREIPFHFSADQEFLEWQSQWKQLIENRHGGMASARERMWKVNPVHIPRNHLVEDALRAAAFDGDYSKFQALMERQEHPYRKKWSDGDLDTVPDGFDHQYATFCGT